MGLYPDILFHFTNQISLYDILRNDFKLSYAREKIISPHSMREFAVPMVSFCDLRLSELQFFVEGDGRYGKYGIGLTKDWANNESLSPVMYLNRHCHMTDNFISGIDGVFEHLNNLHDMDRFTHLNQSLKNIMNMYRYIKNYNGELIRHGVLQDADYRFANEREWRFVPPIDIEEFNAFVPIDQIRTDEQKNYFNETVAHLRLSFEPDDIKYLIVENDDDITDLINHLRDAKERFDGETINRLTSRILTVKQILDDI